MFLSDQDARKLQRSYQKNSNGNYELKKQDQETLQELESIVGMPLAVLFSMTKEADKDLEQIKALLGSNQMTKDQILAGEEQAKQQMGLLVIREAVENCSISLLENATTFLNTLPLKSLPTLAETLAANSPATMDARVIITVIASIFAPVRNI